jgi:hypothetical protein
MVALELIRADPNNSGNDKRLIKVVFSRAEVPEYHGD